MNEWKVYGVCPCGFKTEAPFSDLFHVHMDVCPECGEDKNNWSVVTGRMVKEKAYLFKPSTWGKYTFQQRTLTDIGREIDRIIY